MGKIALVTDSTSDLNKEQLEKHDINMLSLRVVYQEREFIDRVNITPEEVYENMSIEVPSSSLPPVDHIHDTFRRLEQEGYTHVIVVCISSGLSGTYNTINMVSREYPNMEFSIFDSKALSMGTGAIVLECAKMISQGKSFEAIVEELPSMKKRIRVYFIVDTLTYLIKGGRIGKVAGTLGQILKLKPVISINKEGVYYTHAKVRGRRQSIERLMDAVKETLNKGKAKIWVMHGDALKEGKELYDRISKLNNVREIGFSNIGPVLGVHTGSGTLGIVIMAEN